MAKWQLQEAKSDLSELIDRALTDGPQIITRHGVEVVVVMPVARYRKLTPPARNLADFLVHSPLRNSKLVIERDPDAGLPVRPDQPV
jgi:prevent-host-death family protein